MHFFRHFEMSAQLEMHLNESCFQKLTSAKEISLLELNAPLYFHDWLTKKKLFRPAASPLKGYIDVITFYGKKIQYENHMS